MEEQATGWTEFKIKLKRLGEKKLGVDVRHTRNKDTLEIASIVGEGLIVDWNRDHSDLEVKVGDKVVQVNLVSGSSNEMLAAMQADDELEMTIRRQNQQSQAERQEEQRTGRRRGGWRAKWLADTAEREAKAEAERKVGEFLASRGFKGGVNSKKSSMLKCSYPLHVAVKEQDAEMVKLLISAGADKSLKNSSGNTPTQKADKHSKQKKGDAVSTDVLRALGCWEGHA